ncbi:aldo/keto reductase [Caballeronia sordidicola]|uniref:aldo/keto reductase n=1 Tax=Caballeronia sordidicola TaxID=196367 RepID=UPI0004D03F58|nr:aldo/keto reductase [Caballeronia sordidicola]
MEMRTLGKDGPRVSAMGLGCMRMSSLAGPKSGADEEGIATIQAALDTGINFLNTGDFYGMGHNELLVGKAIKGRRDQALISVKFGALRAPSGQVLGIDVRPNAVKNFAAYSLQRLGVDVIDIYQPARIDPDVPIEETVGAIADLIKEGKVRYLGLSETGVENIRRAHKVHPVTALEIEYSLGTRFIEEEILPTVRELDIGLVAYGVVGQGLLTGSVTNNIPANDFRRQFPKFDQENLPKNLEKASLLESMAHRKNCTTTQLAIAWVLSRGEDIVPLVGMSRRARLAENLKAFDVTLSKEDLDDLDRTFALGAITGDRYPAQFKHLAAK